MYSISPQHWQSVLFSFTKKICHIVHLCVGPNYHIVDLDP